jgi:hypothetical protein
MHYVRRRMQIQAVREACCSQDDQAGPLETTYSLSSDATFRVLVEKIVSSGFLQYSSSHVTLLGEVGSQSLVRVFSPYHCAGKEPEFLAPPDSSLSGLLSENAISFRFTF